MSIKRPIILKTGENETPHSNSLTFFCSWRIIITMENGSSMLIGQKYL
ncbi:MAG: hypothetical protein QW186_00475 [Candidatus Bathyarchaeia archaeon]